GKSLTFSNCGSAMKCSQGKVRGNSTRPSTSRRQVARSVSGRTPRSRTGKSLVRCWPGGKRSWERTSGLVLPLILRAQRSLALIEGILVRDRRTEGRGQRLGHRDNHLLSSIINPRLLLLLRLLHPGDHVGGGFAVVAFEPVQDFSVQIEQNVFVVSPGVGQGSVVIAAPLRGAGKSGAKSED